MGLTKKKILVLVDWFKPGYKAGGPIQSSFNFAYTFKDDFQIAVLTTDTDHGEVQPYENIQSNTWLNDLWPGIHILYLNKASFSLKQLKKELTSTNADYVYLNHLFSPYFVLYPLWLKLTGRLKGKLVLCPRGALYDSALSVKPYKKKPVIFLLKLLGLHKKIIFHATNNREFAAIQDFFPGSKTVIADNLPRADQPAPFSLSKKKGEVRCVFISRIVPIKNLLFFLQVLKEVSIEVTLTIVGPVEDKDYWAQCQQMMNTLDKNITVNYIGPKENQEILGILRQHHLFVLPTEGENFGHSIFEALLCGRPVLISDQTPWQNLSAHKAGWDLDLNAPARFREIIEQVGNWSQDEFNDWSNGAWHYAHKFIHNPGLKQPYFELFV